MRCKGKSTLFLHWILPIYLFLFEILVKFCPKHPSFFFSYSDSIFYVIDKAQFVEKISMKRKANDRVSAPLVDEASSPTVSSSSPTLSSVPILSRKEATALRKKARTDEIERKIRELLESKKSIEAGGKVFL